MRVGVGGRGEGKGGRRVWGGGWRGGMGLSEGWRMKR